MAVLSLTFIQKLAFYIFIHVLGLDHWTVWPFIPRPTNHHLHHHKKGIRLYDG